MAKPSLESIFTYHPPLGDQPERYQRLRYAALQFAQTVQALTPASREQSLALTTIQEAVMWANASIAINEVPAPLPASVETSTTTTPTAEPVQA